MPLSGEVALSVEEVGTAIKEYLVRRKEMPKWAGIIKVTVVNVGMHTEYIIQYQKEKVKNVK